MNTPEDRDGPAKTGPGMGHPETGGPETARPPAPAAGKDGAAGNDPVPAAHAGAVGVTRIIPAMPLMPAPDVADDRTRITMPKRIGTGTEIDLNTRIGTRDAPTVIAAGKGAGSDRTILAGAALDRTRLDLAEARAARRIEPVSPGVLINNNYRIQNLISAGGMGEVYRGENVYTGDPVAVKIVLPELARDPEMVALFMREARILGQLHDDAIVRYHNFVLDAGLNRYCLVMEYIDGTHLWDHVTGNGPLDENDALALMRRIALGLARAHAMGVTHRDLSPDNVILRGGAIEDAVLIDFGIARSDKLGEGGLEGRFAGKLKYIAPEQLGHWDGKVDPRTDIYGMALMVAAVLRGKPLAMGTTTAEAAQARRGIPDLGGLGARAMPLLQYMLEPNPAARPAHMRAVVEMLDDPSHVPARYRLPLWQGEEAAAGADGPRFGQAFGTHHAASAIEDSSESPFGALMPDGRGHGDMAGASHMPARKRGWLALVVVLLLGLGGWLTRDGWLPLMPGQGAPVAVQATDQAAGRSDAGSPSRAGSGNDDAGRIRAEALARLPDRNEATRAGWLALRELPACTMARRVSAGPTAGQIALYAAVGSGEGGATMAATASLLNDYEARFNARPGLITRDVSAAQCPVLDFVNALSGRAEAPPVMTLDADRLRSGGSITGRVGDLSGRSLWLFLVTSNGTLRDLSSRLEAAADGSLVFDIGLALGPGEDRAAPQLLVALASRMPLIAAATAADGAPADDILPRALSEIADAQGHAAADIAGFILEPDGESELEQMRPHDSGNNAAEFLKYSPGLGYMIMDQPEDVGIDVFGHH